MIKTCYLLKEKLTNVINKTRCKMLKKNLPLYFTALPNR